MSKPRPPSGHMSDMIIRRMMYDRMRYKVIREYIERRRKELKEQEKYHTMTSREKSNFVNNVVNFGSKLFAGI